MRRRGAGQRGDQAADARRKIRNCRSTFGTPTGEKAQALAVGSPALSRDAVLHGGCRMRSARLRTQQDSCPSGKSTRCVIWVGMKCCPAPSRGRGLWAFVQISIPARPACGQQHVELGKCPHARPANVILAWKPHHRQRGANRRVPDAHAHSERRDRAATGSQLLVKSNCGDRKPLLSSQGR